MESNNLPVEFTWLPSENGLPDIISFFELERKELQNKPYAALKTFLSKLFNLSVQITDFQQKFVLGNLESSNSTDTNKSPIYMFFANYLYQICCTIVIERKSQSCVSNIDERKKLIKIFCSLRSDSPELWLKVDVSDFEDDIRTKDSFIDLRKFSLGNIVKLNKFVEHFNSESSLHQYDYKITQVKVKFLHDEQVMHVYFVVGKEKVLLKNRSAKSHRMHKLVIPYSSLHTVLICHEKNMTVYFRLNTSPMLFAIDQDDEAENYISYLDLQPNANWIRCVELFNGCPPSISKEFSMNYVLELSFCYENYEVMKIMLHHKNVQMYFSPMRVIPYEKVSPSVQFNNFDCYYGFQCLLSHSYEIHDQLMDKGEMSVFRKFVADKCTESPEALSEVFYIIFSAVSQCNIIVFNHSLKTLYGRLSRSNMQDKIKNPNLLRVRKAIIVPTHVRFIPPQLILQNRALCDCDPDYSLRLSIRDVNLQMINFSFKEASREKKSLKNFFETYFKKKMLGGIKIEKRHYKYVGSSTNLLRGHGLWFYAKDAENKTAETLRKTFGDMEEIKQISKFMVCMGQTFSQSQGNIIIPQEYTNVSQPDVDIKGGKKIYLTDEDLAEEMPKFLKPVSDSDDGSIEDYPYIFSDGIGRMSLEIAKQVYEKLDLEESKPSAMQIRYAGCKGILVVDPNLIGKKIVFRKSMKKFPSDSDSLEILKYSKKRTASLNRPLITILEQLGVPQAVFIQLQKQMIQSQIRSMFHETDAYDFLNRNSKLGFNFTNMHKTGFRFTEDPLFRSMIYGLFRKQLDLLITKANVEIPPNKGRSMFGVLDETLTLEYGQVFIQYTDWYTDEAKIFKGTVVVTKNPCMHPGDVRKFEAIDVESLHHIRDCIVFPAKGDGPHSDEMAGSDLDGDEYEVLFLEEFLFSRENHEAMPYFVHKDKTQEMDRDIQPADELDHVCNYIINDNIELIANAHLVFADRKKEGIYSENCLRLAKKYAMALDFAKSGIPAVRNKRDRVFSYPDFMQKLAEKPTYVSKKTLGVLYRSCKKLEMCLEASSCGTKYKLDPDLVYENWEEYKNEALDMYNNYCRKVEYLINIYSLDNEGELLAGAIINTPKYYNQRHELEDLTSLLEHEIQWVFSNLEKQFFDEFSGKPEDGQYTQKMYQKASAWYVVTYDNILDENHQCFGFPWAMSDVLMKLKSERHVHRGYPVANIKSVLEEVVDESLRHLMPVMSNETHIIHKNRFEILNVAKQVLTQWLETLRDLLLPDFKEFDDILCKEFQSVSQALFACDEQHIEYLKRNNDIKKAISPCYYIIETLLNIANVKATNVKIPSTNEYHELGLLSWVTLIKLACSYNPQYLGIADKDGNYASSMFYIPRDNVISVFRLHLFKKECNSEFSLKLLHKPDEVIEHLRIETKVNEIKFRYDIERDVERDCEYVATFTVRGTRYEIEKLKDLIGLDEFLHRVAKGEE